VKTTYTLREAQRGLSGLVRVAESGRVATITRHEKPVAHVISSDRLEALFETMELMADRDFMQAWKREQAGKTRYRPLTALDEA
jgi:prevent-host-death family protein